MILKPQKRTHHGRHSEPPCNFDGKSVMGDPHAKPPYNDGKSPALWVPEPLGMQQDSELDLWLAWERQEDLKTRLKPLVPW